MCAFKRSLVEAAYAPSTLSRYKDAVSRFLSWCSDQDEDPSSPEQFDDLLTDYFHHLCESGLGKQLTTLFTAFSCIFLISNIIFTLHPSPLLGGTSSILPSLTLL